MPRTRYALGVELLPHETRLVLVEATGPEFPVRWAHAVQASDDLARVYRGLRHRPNAVTCCFPLENCALRTLNLPPTTEENLDRAVLMEAETVLPLTRDELALAHLVLGMTEQSRLEVLLAAARQDALQKELLRVNAASWVSSSATLGAVAHVNTLSQLFEVPRDGPIALLQVEPRWSELLVVDRGRPLAAYSLPLGSESAPGGSWEDMVAGRVGYLLQAFSFERGLTPRRLYLCGGGVEDPTSLQRLGSRLGLPTEAVDPCDDGNPADVRYSAAYGCALQAAGAAPLALNLTPARVTVEREVVQQRQNQLSWLAVGGAAAVAAACLVWAAFHQTGKAVAEAKKALGSLPKRTVQAPVPPAKLKTKEDALKEEQEVRVPAARFLEDLSSGLPRGTWLAQLTYNSASGCVLNGYSLDPSGAQRAQTALLQRQLFDDVTLDFRNEERIAEQMVWGFQITCKLRPREKQTRGRRQAVRTGARR
ncbi:MAG: hypothetical protein FJX77_12255 [Armatimonadetes bacterium]|nr:hypothetical protein [Armatimonadota bacterium]